MQFLGIDGWTPQNKEYKSIGDRRVTSLTLGTYGLGGMALNTQRLVKTLKPRVEESLLRIEEYSNEIGNTNKILYTTLFATGTSASTTPIVAEASRSRGLTSMIFGVIPSNLSEGYQRSTLGSLRARHKPVTSEALLSAMKEALEAFAE